MDLKAFAGPRLTTDRLLLRGWLNSDLDAYAGMLADRETSRFITRRAQPYSRGETWAEMAFFAGHWQLLGHGMFVVESLESGAFLGRVGTLYPVGWPGLEIAWALSPLARGYGYATEAATAVADWALGTLGAERIISVIHSENRDSQGVARRIGERPTDEYFAPFGEACQIWELTRGQASSIAHHR
jgi:ribosomal-protein-alanine N-acetyltransferase